MPKKYTAEERERAVRMVREQVPEFGSVTAAAGAVATRLGMSRETIRNWCKQDEIDAEESSRPVDGRVRRLARRLLIRRVVRRVCPS